MQHSIYPINNIGSYDAKDVVFLLKDLSGFQLEDTTEEREKRIQAGQHYSESLPIETLPPKEYVELFWKSLHENKIEIARLVGIVAEIIYAKKGDNTILVSLARGGTPIGILINRYLEFYYSYEIPHYSISIIRGKGFDENALKYICEKHPDGKIQFVDGWTGKGAITKELVTSCERFAKKYGIDLDHSLAVLTDPAHCANIYGTREDILIPSACLNATISGLISRTVLNKQFIGEHDFHGAKYYEEWEPFDVSHEFIQEIIAQYRRIDQSAKKIAKELLIDQEIPSFKGLDEVQEIQNTFSIKQIQLIKPGVGETTRVLLRRVPWKILMKDLSNPHTAHIHLLAEKQGIEVIHYPNMSYSCCGIIKPMDEEI